MKRQDKITNEIYDLAQRVSGLEARVKMLVWIHGLELAAMVTLLGALLAKIL